MERISDQRYLRKNQYRCSDNLKSRIALHNKFSTNNTSWAEWVYQHLALEPGQKVLAVGCGNAVQWQTNAKRFPPDLTLYLMDLSFGMVRDGQGGIGGDRQFNYITGDAQHLPFQEAQFDRVTANHMLYHVPCINQAISACARVLKSDGLFMAATNGDAHMLDYYDLLSEFDAELQISNQGADRFSLQNGAYQLKKAFADVNLKIYPCDLWVTAAKPLVEYAFSMGEVRDKIAVERDKAVMAFFEERINAQGGILIRKQVGVFLASHTPGLVKSLRIL